MLEVILKKLTFILAFFLILSINSCVAIADATFKKPIRNGDGSMAASESIFGMSSVSETKVTEMLIAAGIETISAKIIHRFIRHTNNTCPAEDVIITVPPCLFQQGIILKENVSCTQQVDLADDILAPFKAFKDCPNKLTKVIQRTKNGEGHPTANVVVKETASAPTGARYYFLSDYQSLASTLFDIGSDRAILLCDSAIEMIESESIPVNVSFQAKKGCMITTMGHTLTFSGPLTAGRYQIFSGAGTVCGLEEVYPEWWGAAGDGVKDDGPALTKALAAGRVIRLSENATYLLATPEKTDRMLTIYPNTSIIGSGVNSKIKVGDTVLGTRNVISIDTTVKTLYDMGTIILKDFHIDLNGDNNLRKKPGEAARNNALLRLYCFRHAIIDGIIAENAPGNQVLWIYAPLSVEPNSSVTVKNCRFYRVGNDIAGNYNADHSTSYVQAHVVRQENNLFQKTSMTTTETAMELHGVYTYCENNVVINYNRGAHIVADLKTIMRVNKVSDNYMSTRLHALTYWSKDGIDNVFIFNNTFTGYGGASFTGINMETHVDIGYICNVIIHKNFFKNITYAYKMGAIYFSTHVRNVVVKSNVFDALNWQAINSKATDLLVLERNVFNNCAKASSNDEIIKVTSTCKKVIIQNNSFTQSLYYSRRAVWIAGKIDCGVMSGNTFHAWYDDWPIRFTDDGVSSTSFFVDIELYLVSPIRPDVDVYGSQGSRLKELKTSSEYIRSTPGLSNLWNQYRTSP